MAHRSNYRDKAIVRHNKALRSVPRQHNVLRVFKGKWHNARLMVTLEVIFFIGVAALALSLLGLIAFTRADPDGSLYAFENRFNTLGVVVGAILCLVSYLTATTRRK